MSIQELYRKANTALREIGIYTSDKNVELMVGQKMLSRQKVENEVMLLTSKGNFSGYKSDPQEAINEALDKYRKSC